MLVTFESSAYANITMFGDIAVKLLKLMGHSGTVPSAIEAEDIPEALRQLRKGVIGEEAAESSSDEHEDDEEEMVSLKNRALPLIELLEASENEKVPVMWHS